MSVKMSLKLMLATSFAASVFSLACTRSQDTGQRNMSVPAGSESSTADIDRRESGMTGSTKTTNQQDAKPSHAEKREAVNRGDQSGTTGSTDSSKK